MVQEDVLVMIHVKLLLSLFSGLCPEVEVEIIIDESIYYYSLRS